MKLKSFNYFLGLLIIFLSFTPLKSEEKIDIWKNKKNKKQINKNKKINKRNAISKTKRNFEFLTRTIETKSKYKNRRSTF